MILHASLALLLVTFPAWTGPAPARVEKNVIYGMHSGLALLMDVHGPRSRTGSA